MTTYRIPVVVWQNAPNLFCGTVVEFEELVAYGSSPRVVLEQLRELVEWRYEFSSGKNLPSLKEPELIRVPISCRPEYIDRCTSIRAPIAEPIQLMVTAICGWQASKFYLLSVPNLELRMVLSQRDDVKQQLIHHLTRTLSGHTPQQLSCLIPCAEPRIENIFVQIRRDENCHQAQADLRMLTQIADPLGASRVRRLYGRAWERETVVQQLVEKLRGARGNWLLVGEHGVGKTTILCEAIRYIERELREDDAEQDENELQHNHRYWQTSGGRLIAGMKYLGMWQERLENVIKETKQIGGVLCLEGLSDFIRTGGEDANAGLAAFCIPYLQRGELRIIAEVTLEELDVCRRLLPEFVNHFSIFPIEAMNRNDAIQALQRLTESRDLAPTLPSASRTIDLFQRFERYRALPGEAVYFWRKLLAANRGQRNQNQMVTPELVTARFIQRTGLPEMLLRDDRPMQHEQVCRHLEAAVIGQSAACAAAADVVIAFKAGLNDPRRPLGTLLFCGPTGVGKTELSKELARFLFSNHPAGSREPVDKRTDRKHPFLRLDMSEYAGAWAADRFLLQDNGEPSAFLQSIRQQPFNVVLLDEIEKAHSSVFDILLNILDEGRVTDRYGRVTWFRSAVIVMTSNLGTDSTGRVGYQNDSETRAGIESAVFNFFRPEFFNRLDRVVTFSALTPTVIEQITEKELRQLSQREGLQRYQVELRWTPALVRHIARVGFDPRHGARPLQNALETCVVVPIARWLITNPGTGKTLHLDVTAQGEILLSEIKRRVPS